MRSFAARPLTRPQLRECPGCGLIQSIPALAPGTSAQCARCPTILHRATAHPLDHSIALTTAALVLLLIMCTTTLMNVQKAGITLSAGLFSGPVELVHRAFEFLMARERKESILRKFDLTVIGQYFAEFEQTMKRSLETL